MRKQHNENSTIKSNNILAVEITVGLMAKHIGKIRLIIFSGLLSLIAPLLPVLGAELIMFEQDNCSWCEAWHEEIGGIYHKTNEGKIAPLRRVDIHGRLPEELTALTPAIYTPTFVLLENGKEIARLRGYPGDDFFWYLLDEMLDKLPNSANKHAN